MAGFLVFLERKLTATSHSEARQVRICFIIDSSMVLFWYERTIKNVSPIFRKFNLQKVLKNSSQPCMPKYEQGH